MLRSMLAYLLFLFSQTVVGSYVRLRYRVIFIGKHHRPRRGPGLVIANHTSMLDIPLVGCYLRPWTRFLAKQELWSGAVASWYFTTVQCIPVNRAKPESRVFRLIVGHLFRRRLVGIFPEGHRATGDRLLPFYSSTARIALSQNVPVFCIGIRYLPSSTWWRRTKIIVTYAPPIWLDSRHTPESATRVFELTISKLSGRGLPKTIVMPKEKEEVSWA